MCTACSPVSSSLPRSNILEHILSIYLIIYLYNEYMFDSLGASQRLVSSTCEPASGGSWAGGLPERLLLLFILLVLILILVTSCPCQARPSWLLQGIPWHLLPRPSQLLDLCHTPGWQSASSWQGLEGFPSGWASLSAESRQVREGRALGAESEGACGGR